MITHQFIRTTAALVTTTLVAQLNLCAQTWETVLNYQLAAGRNSEGHGIAADASGNVFSAGNGTDASGVVHGITLKTDTTQANWYFSDDTNPSATQYQSYIGALGLDGAGTVYSIGQLTPNNTGVASWYVRKSSNGGLNWSTADLYQYAAGNWNDPTGFAADDSGNIYVVGWGRDAGTKQNSAGNIHWLVRKSADAGRTWYLADDVTGPTANGVGFVPGAGVFVAGGRFIGTGHSWLVRRSPNGEPGTWSTVDGPFDNAAARGVCGDSQGNIYVAGTQFIATGTVRVKGQTTTTGFYAWVTRKSSDAGSHWSTVDTFTYAQNQSANAWGIGKNSAGNVVVVGNASDSQGKYHWLVRTPDLSGAWYTMDDFQITPGYYAGASGVAADATGNLLVTGTAYDATPGEHWVVRRLAAPAP